MDKIKKIIEKFKNIFNKNIFNKNNKKLGENLVILMIIGVIIIIAGGTLFGGKKEDGSKVDNAESEKLETLARAEKSDETKSLESKVEEILSQINGVGEVKVLITYESGTEIVPFTNIKRSDDIIDEQDSAGGTRKSNQSSYESSIAYEEEGSGVKKPIIVKEMYPKAKGVVVVADGGSDLTVRESLLKAVQVLLDVPVHKIQIYERKK